MYKHNVYSNSWQCFARPRILCEIFLIFSLKDEIICKIVLVLQNNAKDMNNDMNVKFGNLSASCNALPKLKWGASKCMHVVHSVGFRLVLVLRGSTLYTSLMFFHVEKCVIHKRKCQCIITGEQIPCLWG